MLVASGQGFTSSTTTAFLESICTWLPTRKSEFGTTPAHHIHIQHSIIECLNTEYEISTSHCHIDSCIISKVAILILPIPATTTSASRTAPLCSTTSLTWVLSETCFKIRDTGTPKRRLQIRFLLSESMDGVIVSYFATLSPDLQNSVLHVELDIVLLQHL